MPRFKITQGVVSTQVRTFEIEAHNEIDANTKSEHAPDWEWTTTVVSEEIISNNITHADPVYYR